MRIVAVVVVVALGACRPADRGTMPSNASVAMTAQPQASLETSTEGEWADAPILDDLQLVRSYEGRHGVVTLDGLAAARRVFDQIPWKGMPPSSVVALIGRPTMREPAENKWRYDLVQATSSRTSSVALVLQFVNGVVDRTVTTAIEIQLVPRTR